MVPLVGRGGGIMLKSTQINMFYWMKNKYKDTYIYMFIYLFTH